MKALVLALAVTSVVAGPAAAADLKLELRDGRVTLDARDVTVRQILTEWARVGQTRIVNLERVGSGPVTLQLAAVPERQALEIILRSVAGYVAAPRAAGSAGVSAYDRILILASSSAAQASRSQGSTPAGRTPASGMPSRAAVPGLGSPELAPPEPADMADDMDDPAGMAGRAPARPGPVSFGTPPPGSASQPGVFVPPPTPEPMDTQQRPSLQAPAGPTTPATPWSVPSGTVTPGVILETPRPQTAPSGARPPVPDR